MSSHGGGGGFNPNRKKKTYSFGRSQPSKIVATIVDGKVEYFDETLAAVDNDYFVVSVPVSQGIPPTVHPQYDEDVIHFNWTDSEHKNFNTTFLHLPYLTLEILPADGFENVAFFASNLTTTGFDANVSAPFSGQMVYRAVMSPTFPVIIERVVLSSSYYYTASAGAVASSPGDTFSLSYHGLSSSLPEHLFVTVVDDESSGDGGVVLTGSGSLGLTATAVTFSAPVYNTIHFLAVKA